MRYFTRRNQGSSIAFLFNYVLCLGGRAGLAFIGLLAFGCAKTAAPGPNLPPPTAGIIIQPLTQVTVTPMAGYFPDPLPVRIATSPQAAQYFAGSNKAILSGPAIPQAGTFQTSRITIDAGDFAQQARASGTTLRSVGNNNIYQDNQGIWQMATTLHLANAALPGDTTWNAIAHAHATSVGGPVPTAWVIDKLLIGSLAQAAKANYDGKYFEDGGQLYLLYSKALQANPLHDGVVAQLMQSAAQPALTTPVILLAPENADGGYNSEYFFGLNPPAPFKLVETGNITKINGKYVMAYSAGAYNTPGYKSGLAWSDTFLPAAGTMYRKILQPDPVGVWGRAGHAEVVYLLQAQQSAWPNYVGSQVLAPGVPSVVLAPNGKYYLYFAAFDPTDAPPLPGSTMFDPAHRRPYFLSLTVNVPVASPVTAASDADLATWLTPGN